MTENDLMPAVIDIARLLQVNRFEDVDRLIESVDIGAAPTERMVLLLRMTFPVRCRLPSWSKLLRVATIEIANRQLNQKRILAGLETAP